MELKTCLHSRPANTHSDLLQSPLFVNKQILTNPQVKDFTNIHTKKEPSLKPKDYGHSITGSRHAKVLNLLDEEGFKTIEMLKDEQGTSRNHNL